MIHQGGPNAGLASGFPHGIKASGHMNVLVIGSGGREHALPWPLSATPLLGKLYCGPGNAGIAEVAECVELDAADHAGVVQFCRRNAIDFVVIGPEAPLVAGLADALDA